MNELLTAVDLGKVLGGASADQVMEWRRQYDWPHVRIGRKFFWTPEQIEQIQRQHTVTANKLAPSDGRTQRSASRRRSA